MIVIPRSQDVKKNPLNDALTEMVLGNEVVTIYVNESMFDGGESDQNKCKSAAIDHDLCRCLGVFYAARYEVGSDSETVVSNSHCGDPLQKQQFARYKLAPYLKVEFKPLLSNGDLESMWETEMAEPVEREKMRKRKRMTTICIPFDCKDHLETSIPL